MDSSESRAIRKLANYFRLADHPSRILAVVDCD